MTGMPSQKLGPGSASGKYICPHLLKTYGSGLFLSTKGRHKLSKDVKVHQGLLSNTSTPTPSPPKYIGFITLGFEHEDYMINLVVLKGLPTQLKIT